MNICIDMRPALSAPTGVGVYAQNLVTALAEIDEGNEYFLFSSSWKERFSSDILKRNFHVCDRHFPGKILNYAWNHFSFPSIEFLTNEEIEVAHSPTPLLIPSRHARRINTVHDLYFYFHPEQSIREMKTDYPRLIKEHCIKSDAIIVISEYTRQQIIEHLGIPGSKVYTIRHGADPFYRERASEEYRKTISKKWNIDRPFFLFAGTREPRKNLKTLLRAFGTLPGDFKMVLAGAEGWGMEEWSDLLNDRVVCTGYVTKEELRALYQLTLALVMPSWEEGFGLPLLEAMASGTPVIASDIPPFHEVGNHALLPFNPASSEELANCMRRIAEDEELRRQLIQKGTDRVTKFSWSDTAGRTLELYNSL